MQEIIINFQTDRNDGGYAVHALHEPEYRGFSVEFCDLR
jgi:hypothetical protein